MTEQVAGHVDGDDAAPDPVTTPEAKASRPKRVSKWDRPPEPHDWRFYVGGLGKILIATGLLMFGFVAYQLWGTGIETARAQNDLENQFEQFLAESETSTTAPTTVAPTTTPVASVPTSTPTSQPETTEAPSAAVTSVPPAATFPRVAPAPVEQNIPPIERGQALARLEIPKIGVDKIVVPGVALEDLKKGPGHYPETPLPGQLGNASIAGHRTTFGHPFFNIDELAPGDQIIVTMFTGDRFVYEVASTEVVGPDDYFVVTTTDPTVAELTLTSCDPKYTARNRIAVHAFLVADRSDPVGEPTFYDLEANGNESAAGGQDPAVRPDSTDASASAGDVATVDAGSSEAVGSSEAGSSEAAPTATTPELTAPVASGEVQDAFSDGWFHDSGAWPQIALWGGALILIAVACRKISRHFRHDSIGIAVAVLPFVFCLYFFYQNINRLLPPGF